MKHANIYFDNAATTKVLPEVLDTYVKAKTSYFANPSSIHALGQESKRLLDKAREQIASLLKSNNHEVIFTSGATESINLAIKGYALRYQNRGKHLITSQIEHPAVNETMKQLEEQFGFTVTYLPVDNKGHINLIDLKNAIRKDTILVSIMAVNNEVGSIQPIKEIIDILKPYPLITFHSDVTQAIGKIDLPYEDIDMYSFSAHKFHGLNGSGCLIKKKNIELLPINNGGGQENNFRSGTNDVANDVAMAKALRIANENIKDNYDKVTLLADHLYQYLLNNKDKYEIHSGDNPYIVNFSTLNKKASVVVEALSNAGIMVSSTSACHAHKEPLSDVVLAMKDNLSLAKNTIRVSFDASNTIEEVDIFINELERIMGEIK